MSLLVKQWDRTYCHILDLRSFVTFLLPKFPLYISNFSVASNSYLDRGAHKAVIFLPELGRLGRRLQTHSSYLLHLSNVNIQILPTFDFYQCLQIVIWNIFVLFLLSFSLGGIVQPLYTAIIRCPTLSCLSAIFKN